SRVEWSASRLYSRGAGRSRADGALGRRTVSVPRPPRGGIRGAAAADGQDAYAQREVHPQTRGGRPHSPVPEHTAEAAVPLDGGALLLRYANGKGAFRLRRCDAVGARVARRGRVQSRCRRTARGQGTAG